MTKKQKTMRTRILITLAVFAVLMICDHALHLMDGLPVWILFILYLLPYLLIGYDVIRRALKNIRNGQVFDENFLMMVATFAAFGVGEYSEALAVMLFYQIGELFQSVAVGRSRASITEMMSIAPEYANLEDEQGGISEVDPEDVPVGSIIVIKPGEKIPLDGTILTGSSFLDTAALTGESVPRRASEGDTVISGCLNGEGTLRVQVEKAYEDSTVARILEMVENASTRKARLENFITRFARYYTPVVTICAALLAILPPLILYSTGNDPRLADWISRACVFLIVSCPCALVISVPLGFFGGIGAASRIGVLVKGSNFLEAIADTSVIVMDKTGTLTKGEFRVSRVDPAPGTNADTLLMQAAHGESLSNHPIAMSIRQAYEEAARSRASASPHQAGRITDMKEIAGHGISCLFDGHPLLVGNFAFLKDNNITPVICNDPGTVVYVAYDGAFAGSLLISDGIKDGAAEAIAAMKRAGVKKTVMLIGDRKEAAEAVAQTLSVDEVHAELLPADKVEAVESLLNSCTGREKLAFVGD
ncbi:MAG: heavy metal translocating P-type ATPase, partial [Lachnospiraceae bacterium]|nr:heavy metal translocating P-type ATPase [Lachnospiraceae bacterium]